MLKKSIVFFSVALLTASSAFTKEESISYKNQKTLFFRDIYEQNVHSELINQLDFGRQGRRLFGNPLRSQNVNVFDEVPDSNFFVNRHARKRLSTEELAKGYFENNGPDLTNDLIVTGGHLDGLHPVYFVKDSRGDEYVIKFDSSENLELATASEIVGSRFYHAFGYYVPQYSLVKISPHKIKAAPDAVFRDDTGFMKKLTQEKLDETLMFIPQTDDEFFRATAGKVLAGETKGYFSFTGRRKNDPEDLINHRDRREIRALRVIASFVGNDDTRESHTLDKLVTEGGKTFLRHYIFDFNSSLGSAFRGVKPPTFGHEYIADFGDAAKAFLTFGFWEKPWQKRWREAGEKTNDSAAVGYFDNREFNPGKYKTQLPYEAFKRLTRADGFWAAKKIMAFSNDDIRAIVAAGQFSKKEDEKYIADTLIERRDLIGKYWFAVSAPLDEFTIQSGKVIFKDLAVFYGFEQAANRHYFVSVLNAQGKAAKQLDVTKPEVELQPEMFQCGDAALIEIRVAQKGACVRVGATRDSLVSVEHQD